jgi:hypothetical protein
MKNICIECGIKIWCIYTRDLYFYLSRFLAQLVKVTQGEILFFRVHWLRVLHITAVGCHWGPVIQTSARIGSPGPGRSPYSHCGWVPLRPSDSDFSQNWKSRTGKIPLLSLWLGAIEAQWFRLQPELEAQDREDAPTLTVVGCHWGPVIQTSARIGSPGPGRSPYSHCGWVPLRPSDSNFARIGSLGPGKSPTLRMTPRGLALITANPHNTLPLINQCCTGEPGPNVQPLDHESPHPGEMKTGYKCREGINRVYLE